MTISVHEAQVSKATITINTLTIGAKQVTLAVFRQLLSESVIDFGTKQFRGLPWGTVNYHPDCVATDSPHRSHHGGQHRHVVWQMDDELRRATVYEPCSLHEREYASDAANSWLMAGVLAGWRPEGWEHWGSIANHSVWHGPDVIRVIRENQADEKRVPVSVSDEVRDVLELLAARERRDISVYVNWTEGVPYSRGDGRRYKENPAYQVARQRGKQAEKLIDEVRATGAILEASPDGGDHRWHLAGPDTDSRSFELEGYGAEVLRYLLAERAAYKAHSDKIAEAVASLNEALYGRMPASDRNTPVSQLRRLLWREAEEHVAAVDKAHAEYRSRWNEILDLPQLFIAV